MGRGGASTGTLVGLCMGTVTLIITIALLAASWAVLTPQEYGLKFNGATITMDDDTVYSSGRIYVGVGGSFYKFPRKLTYVEFSAAYGNALDVWSADGQQLFVEASFYYQLKGDKIHDIFYTYGTGFGKIVYYMAAETIRNVATDYVTADFFTNRSAIDQTMQAALQARLSSEAFSSIVQFNLLAIDVPNNFDDAIVNKVITGQDVITLEQLRQSQVIRSQISTVNATANANVTVMNAAATATGYMTTQSTSARLFNDYMNARASELLTLYQALNFTSPKQLFQYLYTDVIRGNTVARTTLAVDVNGVTTRV